MRADDPEDNLVLLPEFESEPEMIVHPRPENGFCPLDFLHSQRGMPRVRDQDLDLSSQT